jgi:hypothetical protein
MVVDIFYEQNTFARFEQERRAVPGAFGRPEHDCRAAIIRYLSPTGCQTRLEIEPTLLETLPENRA